MGIKGYWADLKAPDFKALPSDAIAVLPLGATEQHGPHLPMSVDSDLTDAVAGRMLGVLGADQSVLVLPTLTMTRSAEHGRHPGTLSLSTDTLLAVIREIGGSVAQAGITRLVLFNGHGGNTALLEVVARDLRIEHDLIITTTSWGAFADWSELDPETIRMDLHAGLSETSAMLAVRPGHVDMSVAENFQTEMQVWAKNSPNIGLTGQQLRPAWIIDDLNAAGVCGDASAATAAIGEALIQSAAKNFADALAELAKFDHRAKAQ